MTASFEGHDDIVRMLIETKAQVNTQDEVCTQCKLPLPPEIHCTTCHHTQYSVTCTKRLPHGSKSLNIQVVCE